jgi:hypothetical protein
MGAVRALWAVTAAAMLRRRLEHLRRHLWIAAIAAGLAVGCSAMAIGFLGGALYSFAEREIGPVGGALSVAALAAILAVIAVLVVRSELRASVTAGGKISEHEAATPSAVVEAKVLAHNLAHVGKKPDFMQLAALVALGIVVSVLRPTHRR